MSLTGLLAVALAVVGVIQVRRLIYENRLPKLPTLSGQSAAIAGHLREADRAARANPTTVSDVGALCVAYHADLFYDQADRCYAVAESLNPDDWHWTYYRALAQNARGNGAALVSGMHRVVTKAPQYGPAWWRLGEAEFKLGDYDHAEQAWQRAASAPEPARSTAPESPAHIPSISVSAYAMLGRARIALLRGSADRAREILETVVVTTPRFGEAWRVLADSYTASNRPADAARALRRADRLRAYAPYADPLVDALVRESRSSTFLLQQAAEADIDDGGKWAWYVTKRAVEFDPDNPDALYQFGSTLRKIGRCNDALPFFDRYHGMLPDDLQALGQIGVCLTDLGQFAEAEPLLRRTAAGLDDATSHYNLGVVLARLGRAQEAVAEYERALTHDSDDVNARGNLAAILVRQGNMSAASAQLARALEIDPDNPKLHVNLGVVLTQQGQIDRAAGQFSEALRLDPRQEEARAGLQAIGR